jgi:hypothetical protein
VVREEETEEDEEEGEVIDVIKIGPRSFSVEIRV